MHVEYHIYPYHVSMSWPKIVGRKLLHHWIDYEQRKLHLLLETPSNLPNTTYLTPIEHHSKETEHASP